jgi:hypothetical protein
VVSPAFAHSWRNMRRCALLAVGALMAAACGAPSGLRADTRAYIDKMSSWAPIEAETARALDRILATQFVDHAEVLRQIADSAPRVRRHLQEIEQYTPRTPEVQLIHANYTNAWRGLLQGYGSIEAGLDDADQARLAAGRQALLGWRASILTVARQLRQLSAQLELEPSTERAS